MKPTPTRFSSIPRVGVDFVAEEKIDGIFSAATVVDGQLCFLPRKMTDSAQNFWPNCHKFGDIICGEFVRAGQKFYPFDCVKFSGENVWKYPLLERREFLRRTLSGLFDSNFPVQILPLAQSENFSGLYESIVACGGEGIVIKPKNSPYNCGWVKVKRSENFIVRVVKKNGPSNSVEVEETENSFSERKKTFIRAIRSNCGLYLPGGKYDTVRPGSILKITGFGQTAGGKIREPRLDKDSRTSWLVEF